MSKLVNIRVSTRFDEPNIAAIRQYNKSRGMIFAPSDVVREISGHVGEHTFAQQPAGGEYTELELDKLLRDFLTDLNQKNGNRYHYWIGTKDGNSVARPNSTIWKYDYVGAGVAYELTYRDAADPSKPYFPLSEKVELYTQGASVTVDYLISIES